MPGDFFLLIPDGEDAVRVIVEGVVQTQRKLSRTAHHSAINDLPFGAADGIFEGEAIGLHFGQGVRVIRELGRCPFDCYEIRGAVLCFAVNDDAVHPASIINPASNGCQLKVQRIVRVQTDIHRLVSNVILNDFSLLFTGYTAKQQDDKQYAKNSKHSATISVKQIPLHPSNIHHFMDLEQPTPRGKQNAFLPIILSLVLILGIWLGYFLNNRIRNASVFSQQQGSGNEKINSLLDYIEYQYVDTINKKDLVEKTVTSLLESLDPHSAYIPASDFSAVNEPLEGNFDGIGVEFNIFKDTIRVINTIEGGPSEKTGILDGDKFIKIEGKKAAGVGITNKEVFEKLRGPRGSTVNVSIMRAGIKDLLDFKITRDAIPLYSLDAYYMVDPSVGYIKISKFAATTYDEYLKAFNALSKQGMKKLILDLRGNPGGYLNAAVDISDEFLANGLQIVYTQGKANPKKIFKATERGSFEKNGLAVLIDEGSASASEIVAGAVQDNDRGIIVGRRSFGKGLVQDQMQLPDGSAIRLTIARYYTPTGRCIQKPYTDDKDEYYNEEYDRYDHGELLNIDSIKLDKKQAFKTPEGKTVYGGGGIMPDVFVPIDTSKTNSVLNKLFYAGVVNTFAFEYSDNNRAKLKSYGTAKNFIAQFQVTQAILDEFFAYCEKLKAKVDPAAKARAGVALKPYLKALIGRDIFDKDAYYPIINENDKCILKAAELLNAKS